MPFCTLRLAMTLFSALFQLSFARSIQPRALLEYATVVTVPTETGLTWCRPYPDEMGDVVTYYYEPTSINVTCWAWTSMNDSKGLVNGDPLWLKEDTGCWINEEYVQGANIAFQHDLRQCQTPHHMVGLPLDKYSNVNGTQCYKNTTLSSNYQYLPVAYLELGCTTEGDMAYHNHTWMEYLHADCWLPGAIFDPTEFHGTSVGNCVKSSKRR